MSFKNACGVIVVVYALMAGQGQGKIPGAPDDKTIDAQRFILRDKSGKPRAVLSCDTTRLQSPELSFFDDEGHIRLTVGLDAESHGVLLINGEHNRPRVELMETEERSGAMVIYGDTKDPNPMATLSTTTQAKGADGKHCGLLSLANGDGLALHQVPELK